MSREPSHIRDTKELLQQGFPGGCANIRWVSKSFTAGGQLPRFFTQITVQFMVFVAAQIICISETARNLN